MNTNENFFGFLDASTSPFSVIDNSAKLLDNAGFQLLSFDEPWELKEGASYYVKLYDSALFAFHIGKDIENDMILRMSAAHTDFPCFRVKPNPDMREKGYIRINTEAYGGMILSSWFDRPLSIAGKVALRSKKLFEPNEILIDLKKPLMVIPNLAIHLNRDVNKGVEINKQRDVLPLLGTTQEDVSNNILRLLAERLDVATEDILDYDLFIYNLDKATTVGINEDFICSPRLDDLSSVYGILEGITGELSTKDIHMACLFDNEEIGNRTKQGSESLFITMLLEKIFNSIGKSRINLYEVLQRSVMLSIDVAQGYHPNYSTKYDPTNIAELNKGIAFKIDTAQRYAFDTGAIAMIQQLCDDNEVAYQKFTNRSDATAGSTMGPVLSTQLPVRTVDIGVPLLGMHSAVETMGSKDMESMIKLMKAYYSSDR